MELMIFLPALCTRSSFTGSPFTAIVYTTVFVFEKSKPDHETARNLTIKKIQLILLISKVVEMLYGLFEVCINQEVRL